MKTNKMSKSFMDVITRRAIDMFPLGRIEQLIKSRMLYVIDIANVAQRIAPGISKVFRHVPDAAFDNCDNNDVKIVNTCTCYNAITEFIDFTVWRGTPIILKRSLNVYRSGGGRRRGNSRDTDDAIVPIEMITINAPNHVKNMKLLIDKLIKYANKIELREWGDIVLQGKCSLRYGPFVRGLSDVKCRTFDDIFITKKIRDEITTSLDKFISKRDWYNKNHIPYHFGILLYSDPGTGKSSLAQAICKYIGGRLLVVSGDDIGHLDGYIDDAITSPVENKYLVVLVEDIDCGMDMDKIKKRTYSKESDDKDEASGFATILNTIDGVNAPQNVIYIFTTNHIDKLDPALIRPGRIDLKIEVGCVCKETFDQFCKRHYGKEPHVDIKPGITFAQLQVEVMKEKSYEELIKFVTE